ncbi:MAG: hypothetical protein WAN65_11575, partial [Candidatus Sulfotelmatobacter sp.]
TADNGDDVLIGGSGNDKLFAAGGRALLFGGSGADTLTGGSGESILLSGTTKFDSNLAMIDNLLAYWSRTDLDYATRVSNLRAGVSGISPLNSTNVLNDSSADTLTAGSGLDWYFAKLSGSSKDTINSQSNDEQVN